MNNAILIVYSAAAMSFGAGLARDWMVVHQLASPREFFGAMYAIAFASSFAVNEISFRANQSRIRAREAALIVASTVLCVVMLWTSGIRDSKAILVCLPMPALYIVGAKISRSLLERGVLFFSRIRDGFASVVMVALIVAGFQLISLVAATLIATLFFAFLLERSSAEHRSARPSDGLTAETTGRTARDWLRSMIYSNMAISLITLWALFANNHGTSAFGHPAPIVVRVSLYVFQILSIPAVLVVRLNLPHHRADLFRIGVWVGAACLVGSAALPLAVASLAVPVAAIATLYLSLFYMRADHLRVVAAS
jgi:hypothetical protein